MRIDKRYDVHRYAVIAGLLCAASIADAQVIGTDGIFTKNQRVGIDGISNGAANIGPPPMNPCMGLDGKLDFSNVNGCFTVFMTQGLP